jgi:hypothetical protein
MSKQSDISIAKELIKRLDNVAVANPLSEKEAPDPKRMAASIALAVVAKAKVGAAVNSAEKAYILQQGKDVLEGKAARCDQFAAAVCYLLDSEPKFVSCVDLLGNGLYGAGTHCWVLCGRDQSTDISKVAQWGNEAFTIDVWVSKQGDKPAVNENPMTDEWNTKECGTVVLLTHWDTKTIKPAKCEAYRDPWQYIS